MCLYSCLYTTQNFRNEKTGQGYLEVYKVIYKSGDGLCSHHYHYDWTPGLHQAKTNKAKKIINYGFHVYLNKLEACKAVLRYKKAHEKYNRQYALVKLVVAIQDLIGVNHSKTQAVFKKVLLTERNFKQVFENIRKRCYRFNFSTKF